MYNRPKFITRVIEENAFQFSSWSIRHIFLHHLLALAGEEGMDSDNGKEVFGGRQ